LLHLSSSLLPFQFPNRYCLKYTSSSFLVISQRVCGLYFLQIRELQLNLLYKIFSLVILLLMCLLNPSVRFFIFKFIFTLFCFVISVHFSTILLFLFSVCSVAAIKPTV